MLSTSIFAIALPFMQGVGIGELAIILVIVLILFGPKRLPALGKSLGKTFKSLKDGIDGKLDEGAEADAAEATSDKKAEPVAAEGKKSKPRDDEA